MTGEPKETLTVAIFHSHTSLWSKGETWSVLRAGMCQCAFYPSMNSETKSALYLVINASQEGRNGCQDMALKKLVEIGGTNNKYC